MTTRITYLRNAALLMSAVFLCWGCNSGSNNSKHTTKKDSTTATAASDTATPAVAAVRKFLNWYKQEHNGLDTILLVDFTGKGKTAQYRVNFPNADQYLQRLKASGYLSDSYISHQQQYFKKADETLVAHKQKSGPPEGFDYDLVLFSQDPDAVLQNIQALKQAGAQTVVLPTKDNQLVFTVEQTGDKYLVTGIKVQQ